MGLFKSIGNIIKKPVRAAKKVLKSPLGKAALIAGIGVYGPKMFGAQNLGFQGGWGQAATKLPPWLYSPGVNTSTMQMKGMTPIEPSGIFGSAKNFISGLSPTQKALGIAGITAGTAAAMGPKIEEEEEISLSSGDGYEDYLTARKMFVPEWAEWDSSTADTPLFRAAHGGRVHANVGMYAGNNPMSMGQGQGIASMTNNPMMGNASMNMGMNMNRDPRMAMMQQQKMAMMKQQQMMQQQKMAAATKTGAVPKQTEDAELIQLIKMLSTMGIPMEQLRGRTKEELVELAVSIKKTPQGGVKETADVIEQEDIREQNQAAGGGLMRMGYKMGSTPQDAVVEETQEIVEGMNQGGLMRTGYAMGTSQFGMGTEQPIIPSKDGMQIDYRNQGGYQPHGKAEKHDDVRALLAQGEFVMTSDAVKGMGGGDREKGAKKMYDLMHNMEALA